MVVPARTGCAVGDVRRDLLQLAARGGRAVLRQRRGDRLQQRLLREALDCAIELRLDPDCSCCCSALVLMPRVLDTAPSMFCQSLVWLGGGGCTAEMLPAPMGLTDMWSPILKNWPSLVSSEGSGVE